MAFLEQRMDARIERGAQGGPTNRGRTKLYNDSGVLDQVFGWQAPVHEYDVSHGVRGPADIEALRSLWYVVNFTPYTGFRFRDWADYRVSLATGSVLATGTPTGQLNRRYTYAGISFDRKITKPVADTVLVKNGATTLTAGAHYTLNAATGMLTWSATVVGNVTAVAVGATTQVTLNVALAGVGVGDRLYLAGLGGADAGLLNGRAHAISAVAGPVYTLSAATTGKVITPSGTGAVYPGGKATDALAWSGEFDVPVTFSDNTWIMQIEAMAGEGVVGSCPPIKLEEVRRP